MAGDALQLYVEDKSTGTCKYFDEHVFQLRRTPQPPPCPPHRHPTSPRRIIEAILVFFVGLRRHGVAAPSSPNTIFSPDAILLVGASLDMIATTERKLYKGHVRHIRQIPAKPDDEDHSIRSYSLGGLDIYAYARMSASLLEDLSGDIVYLMGTLFMLFKKRPGVRDGPEEINMAGIRLVRDGMSGEKLLVYSSPLRNSPMFLGCPIRSRSR